MKRFFYLFALALGVLASSACGKQPTPSEQKGDGGKQNLIDLLRAEDQLYQDLVIESTYKGRKMTYSVWLPGGAASLGADRSRIASG